MSNSSQTLLRERVGEALGHLGAPLVALTSAARQAHAALAGGVVLRAQVEALAADAALGPLAERLQGPALVAFSSEPWKDAYERVHELRCAIRFLSEGSPADGAGEQDLALSTLHGPLGRAIPRTKVHDFLANTYAAEAPFHVAGVGRVKWRLSSEHASTPGGTRLGRLLATVAEGDANLLLAARRLWHPSFVRVARVALLAPVDLELRALDCDPPRTGRGIVPAGFVHALQRGAQAARRRSGPGSVDSGRAAS